MLLLNSSYEQAVQGMKASHNQAVQKMAEEYARDMRIFRVFAFFLILLGIIVITINVLPVIIQFIQNCKSPLINEQAIVVNKNVVSTTTTYTNGSSSTTRRRYITFQLENGEYVECFIFSIRMFHSLHPGVSGYLTHKGTRFIGFQRNDIYYNS